MKKVSHIIGADLSKRTIDLFCHLLNDYIQIENNLSGFKELIKWIKRLQIKPSELMIVMEHTGLYSFCFEQFLHEHQIAFSKVNALAIKRSMGLVRGKSDKIDARRIAEYGNEKTSKLKAETRPCDELQRLQLLHSTRDRLVKQKAALLNALKEYDNIGLSKQDSIMRSQMRLVKSFENEIVKIEEEINGTIEQNPSLRQNYQLLQTLKGVGKVLATATIIKTKNFTRFANARKFACYCGTAPFEHTSGTSIKGKTKVSHLADKHMKTLLDLAAKSAIQYDKELHNYYLKRVESGKSKMSTINVVRNKIIYRMFAVIKRQTPFV
ncbi:IS110 family RNA-guided transposase, partial [Pinibacter aurantiacus]